MNYLQNIEKPETSSAADTEIECEIYSRISGYYRPVKQYNKGKKSEFADRKYLKYREVL